MSSIILVFRDINIVAKFQQGPPNVDIKHRWGMKSRDFQPVSHFIGCCHRCSCLRARCRNARL